MNVQNIKLNNLGTVNKNAVVITTDKGTVELYFSYQTIVGFQPHDEARIYVIQNQWSTTTGKLLNELEPDKKRRLSPEEFAAKLQTLFTK